MSQHNWKSVTGIFYRTWVQILFLHDFVFKNIQNEVILKTDTWSYTH